jgi:hypothetical protein
MEKHSLGTYVIAVIVVLIVINFIFWKVGGVARLKTMEAHSLSFLIGMLAMYIAVHFYSWK